MKNALQSSSVRLEIIRRLTETLEGTSFKPEHAAIPGAEMQIWNGATSECDYNTQIHELFSNLELYPKADQRSLESNNPFSNQFQISQDLGMMPPQSMNSSQHVLPITGQPSTSREQQSQLLLQQQQQKMMHQSLRMTQTQPNLSTLGGSLISSAALTARMSNSASRQEEMQLKSQNQLALQKQQQMMHQNLLMTKTQRTNIIQHWQQMMDQSLQTTQKQQNLLALGRTVGMSSAASVMGLQRINVMQEQQLHQEQKAYAGTHSDPVNLPEDLPDHIR